MYKRWFEWRQIEQYTNEALAYLEQNLAPESPPSERPDARIEGSEAAEQPRSAEQTIRFCLPDRLQNEDDGEPLLQRVAKVVEQRTEPTFTERLIALVGHSGRRDAEIYRAARIDRRLFSKIMSDQAYQPSKDTAIALALALHLSLDETNALLASAGYTLSHGNKRDLVIEYLLTQEVWCMEKVNEVLYRLGQRVIGRAH